MRLQDYKSIIEDYNHVIHKICAMLHFCEKEPSKVDKIEKTLQTMLHSDRILQHQYHARNYQNYTLRLENHFICNTWNIFFVCVVQSRLQERYSLKNIMTIYIV
jgi:hypothetical protein